MVCVDKVERLGELLDQLSFHAVIINNQLVVVVVVVVVVVIYIVGLGFVFFGIFVRLCLFLVLLLPRLWPLRRGPREAPRKRIPTHRDGPSIENQLLQ